MATVPRIVHSWTDDSVSETSEAPHVAEKFGLEESPDVLYSVNYVDQSQRLLFIHGSNEEIDVQSAGPSADKSMPETNGEPVIEIRRTAVCASKQPKFLLDACRNIYRGTLGPDATDEEKEEAALKDAEMKAARTKYNVQDAGRARMIIHSQYLQDAIGAVDESTRILELTEPYAGLYHLQDELAHYRDNQPACHDEAQRTTTAKHIDVLLNYLQDKLGEKCRTEMRRYQKDPPMATYACAWMLYKPHEVAYAKRPSRYSDGPPQWRAYVIRSVDVQDEDGGYGKLRVQCWHLAHINGQLQRESTVFTMREFTGEQPIEYMQLIPERFFPQDLAAQGGLSMSDWQIKLGRQFWELMQGPAYKEYIVPAENEEVDDGSNDDDDSFSSLEDDSDSNSDSDSGNGKFVPPKTKKRTRAITGGNGEQVERVVVDIVGHGKYCRRPPPGHMQPYGPGGNIGYPGAPHMGGMVPGPPRPPVVTENSAVKKFAPHCECDVCWDDPNPAPKTPGRFAEFAPSYLASRRKPKSDLFFKVCDVEVPAFLLSDRQWIFVHLAHLRPVQADREAFESLVLDPEVKTTVRALVGKFAHDTKPKKKANGANEPTGRVSPWPRDIVKNKGEGRIFLLHGSPGVGKTCTAECIAELAQRPLLALTSGDISTELSADAVERNLDMYLRLGERYGALVLLDEADIFLEARKASDLHRNGLVSVFLRALEYFRGVLFLTTNRVEAFDDAFTSRIHVALHYRPLTADGRRRVWIQHFARIERDSGGRIFVLRSAREYAYDSVEVHALELNGREIRNALQTAVALAEAEAVDLLGEEAVTVAAVKDKTDKNGKTLDSASFENSGEPKVTVTEKHLRAVIKMSAGFKKYTIEARAGIHG
ncbi:hypothetical protein SCUCBS95973_006589 [Sporothrix curviconia]|uniref:AAA+ ATPase domain-containing protein n=1 Tax=Sporothrix curviconia TaxID=1260050 RepID=A0ABP0C8I8_9PEZI